MGQQARTFRGSSPHSPKVEATSSPNVVDASSDEASSQALSLVDEEAQEDVPSVSVLYEEMEKAEVKTSEP